ncbi:RNA polymerase sigma-70 factor [Dyadobacter sp. CY323]|uniref:RNA polymerase sigma-70 factor n=1 Tax=Dyadobacter sp. CY323 TaxID=2907302 RepID=UPI001F2DE730|nr:RNA polymerase sigma-70 factor [Dyadobacter sp. CY323]MCE6992514.1 RNA polymerase sigma-70 factor [Dyadobacter sp. CY323]
MADIYLDGLDNAQSGRKAPRLGTPHIETVVTDDELLLRNMFQEDSQKACALLFRRYYVNLCNHAVRFVHSKEIAEDIVSEVFAGFWQNRVFEQITTSYRAYLYKSVRHRSYNYLKWQLNKTTSLDFEDLTVISQDLSPDEILHYSELHHRVETIIQNLPPQCRRAYLLKRIEGKKYDEIASELQISPKAVEALVSRALARLRNELRGEWFLGGLLFFYTPF